MRVVGAGRARDFGGVCVARGEHRVVYGRADGCTIRKKNPKMHQPFT